MKCTVIFGSPRKDGNTASLLKIVTEEIKKHGIETEQFNAYEINAGGCIACLGCQQNNEKICCVIDDGMQPILRSVEESQMIMVAAPVYLWSLPAPEKAILDRLVYSGCKYYGDDPAGPSLFEGKKLSVVTTCGYPTEKGADLLEASMKRYCRHTKMDYAGMLCERQKNLKEQFMDKEKAARAKAFAVKLLEFM